MEKHAPYDTPEIKVGQVNMAKKLKPDFFQLKIQLTILIDYFFLCK